MTTFNTNWQARVHIKRALKAIANLEVDGVTDVLAHVLSAEDELREAEEKITTWIDAAIRAMPSGKHKTNDS